MRAWIAVFSLLLSLVGELRAQDLAFRKLDMRNGLSFNSVMCIKESSDGLLWVGTREGLNRYNGYEFRNFKHSPHNPSDLSNNHINVIFEDSRKQIWIGTANGLNRYHPKSGNFSVWYAQEGSGGLSNSYVKSIAEEDPNTLWVGTSNGLSLFDLKKNTFRHVHLSPPYANNIIALFKDEQKRIWMGTKGGLYVWQDGKAGRVMLDPEVETANGIFEIRDIRQDSLGKIWVATEENGVYAFEYGNSGARVKMHWNTQNSGVLSNQVRKLLVEKDRVWAATLSGLYIADLKKNTFTNISYSIRNPDGLSRGSIHDIVRDRFGGYWVATYSGGLNYHHSQNHLFKHYKQSPGTEGGLSENDVNGFLEDAGGNIWISTGRGLNHYQYESGKFLHYNAESPGGLSNRIVKAMTADKKGNLWIGTYNGLNYFDTKTGRFRHFHHEPGRNSLNQNQVHALYYDTDDQLWIGMNVGEFQVYNPQRGTFSNIPGIGSIVSYIYEDRSGRLWIGSRSGLRCMDRVTREIIDISDLIRGYEDELLYINWIMEDRHGRLWIGTQGSGLFLIRNRQLHWFGQGKGLSGNTVNAILEDKNGHLWLSTNSGISRLEYREDASGNPAVISTDFSEIHGLQGPQFNPASALKTSQGNMLFGGINGFNIFKPEVIRKEIYFPEVHFDRVQHTSGGTTGDSALAVPVDSAIKLRYAQRNIYVEFSGVNFVNPDGIFYRYSLSSLNNGWVETGKLRSVNFTYLPIGTHQLKVQATSQPGVWGKEFSTLTITVLPPWWLTRWAYLGYFLLAAATVYWALQFLRRRNEVRNKRMVEEIMREKEQKMLASRLEFFTDISHELRTPLTLILTPLEKLVNHPDLPEKVSHQLHVIQRNGKKMMSMISQVLNLRRFEHGGPQQLYAESHDLVSFLKEIFLSFKPLAAARNIHFHPHFEREELPVYFDNNKLEIVIQNLLSNAFKFTPEDGEVILRLGTTEREATPYISIDVENTGPAIPPDTLDKLFNRFYSADNPEGIGIGLELTRRMVELHRGFMEVHNTELPEKNTYLTRFRVFFPLNPGIPSETPARELLREEEDEWPAHEVKLPNVTDPEKQTLLLVEDNPEIRELIRDLFVSHYTIEEAVNGEEGWQLAQKISPDLIISDIMMPVMDGIELCRRLKTDIKTSHIPVILLTARATIAYKYEGYETGADAYITKPFSGNYLLLRVKNLIRQRNTLRQHLQRESFFDPGTVIVNTLDDKILRKAKEYVEAHMTDTSFTIEEMSRELGLSRMHFHRKIKSLTGLSPAEFVRNIRLKRAAAILQQNNVSVKETMVMVGFENADHFRNCFKEQFGVTPSEYKP